MYERRRCAVCGRDFLAKSWNAKYCKEHRTTVDFNARYGWKHQQERAKWKGRVARGDVLCTRCGRLIFPSEAWDLDHAEDGTYLGPAHARCNRSSGGRKRHRKESKPLLSIVERPSKTSRRW